MRAKGQLKEPNEARQIAREQPRHPTVGPPSGQNSVLIMVTGCSSREQPGEVNRLLVQFLEQTMAVQGS